MSNDQFADHIIEQLTKLTDTANRVLAEVTPKAPKPTSKVRAWILLAVCAVVFSVGMALIAQAITH